MPSVARRRYFLALSASCALSCGEADSAAPRGMRYLDDAAFRRAELVSSLVNPDNGYSLVRLAHYASRNADDWDRLPEWNPRAEPIAASELDARVGASMTSLSEKAVPLALPDNVASEDDPRLVALGAAAFTQYPTQLAPYLSVVLASRDAAARYGVWVDDALGVGGLVRARMADGTSLMALTCATCHAAPSGGKIEMGLPNANLNLGAAMIDAPGGGGDPGSASALAAWGPGRLDVTTTDGTEPASIPDLRPARWLTYLHRDATLSVRDRTALAIRIETLIIGSHALAVRPPRIVALALAAYLASLADALPSTDAAAAASPQGASAFAARCSSCHVPPSLTGPPVPLAIIGTDPTLGLSADRTTGAYRVPSLHGVGTRGPLLHDGTIPSLDAMFDPARLTPAFAEKLHGSGAVPGHPFGLELATDDRLALLAYLRNL